MAMTRAMLPCRRPRPPALPYDRDSWCLGTIRPRVTPRRPDFVRQMRSPGPLPQWEDAGAHQEKNQPKITRAFSSAPASVIAMYAHLIIDTGAILAGEHLSLVADKYWTVDEVLLEIRDKHSRERLANLPFQLLTRAPSDAAIKTVAAVSRLSGNYWSLSKPDLLVLALAYMFEKEENGDQFLGRSHLLSGSSSMYRASVVAQGLQKQCATAPPDAERDGIPSVAPGVGAVEGGGVPGGGGWVTPDNFSATWNVDNFGHQHVGLCLGERVDQRHQNEAVACVTGDFAMQNVLLQMHMNVVAISGRVIREIRHFVLKCDACYRICTDLAKLFCPFCGSNALAKLSYSVGENGIPQYHYKKGRRVNIRGTKFSLPSPRGGRQGDLLLREDQLFMGKWRQKSLTRRQKASVFGERVTESMGLSLARKGGDLRVGVGGRNPNSARGRDRRGKKKKRLGRNATMEWSKA